MLKSYGNQFFDAVQKPYRQSAQSIQNLEERVKQQFSKKPKNPIDTHSFWSFWIIGLVIVWVWLLISQSINLIYLIITAFIIAMAIESIIRFFASFRGISRGFAIGLSYFLLFIFLLTIVIIVIPFILSQLIEIWTSLIEQLASWQRNLQQQWLQAIIVESSLPDQVKERLVTNTFEGEAGVGSAIQTALVTNVDQLVSFWTSSLRDAWNIVVSLLSGFFSVAFQFVVVFVLSVFFSLEKDRVMHLIAQVSGQVERTELLLMKVYRKLWLWLKWQAVLSLIIFVMVYLWLLFIWLDFIGVDIPNKFTLALIAWMVEFIPYLWPFLGMFPALLIGVSLYGFKGLVAILILYRAIQQSENNILVPMVMSHTLWASPLLIFICMVLWWTLFGFLWILLAVPISVIVSILYSTYSNSIDE